MPKPKTIYVCDNCGFENPRWEGKCPSCEQWNTFVEAISPASGGLNSGFGVHTATGVAAAPAYLSTIRKNELVRLNTGISEFDRVLGGGFVRGQVVLLSGEPGIGKSTLLTELAKAFAASQKDILYICGEESPAQIKLRAERMGYAADNLLVATENSLENVVATIEKAVQTAKATKKELSLVIVDSIQTLFSSRLTGISGSLGQLRLATQVLTEAAKRLSLPIILVGHVTKEGTLAGPKVLEHVVDTVLYLEGDTQHQFRVLKTTKNRFGPLSEVGLFEMREAGLLEVQSPSELFLADMTTQVPGTCVTALMEGYRPLLFEIQALTPKSTFGYPKRTASGFNVNRLQVLLALLEQRANINVSAHDVYLNVVSGFKVEDYAADLAVCLAVGSSIKNVPIKPKIVAFGECGLSGEIRGVAHAENRVKEAKKLGFTTIISPDKVKYLGEAIKQAL